jgi:hypothetical protein
MTTMPRHQSFGLFFVNYRSIQKVFVLVLSTVNGINTLILTKTMGWATFWAVFSPTHPVTLAPSRIP